MENKKKKNIVIIALCLMVVFISVGYAALSQTLIINGTGNVSGNWNIEIIDISVSNNGNAKTPTATNVSAAVDNSDKTRASFQAQLLQPGDYITYDVTVKNKGTIDAYLSSITLTPDHNDFITFTTTANTYLNTTLAAKDQITFTVTAAFPHKANDTMPENNSDKTLTAVLTLNYVQANGGVQPTPIDDGNGGTSPAPLSYPALTYPMSGTISQGNDNPDISYTLTNGKLTINANGYIANEWLVSIFGDIMENYITDNNITGADAEAVDRGGDIFLYLTMGLAEYENVISTLQEEEKPSAGELAEYQSALTLFQNIVPITEVEIGNDVTGINTESFEYMAALETISVPQGLTLDGYEGEATIQPRSN